MNAHDVAHKALAGRAKLAKRLPGLVSRVAGHPIAADGMPWLLEYSKVVIWQRDIYPIAVRQGERFEGSRLLERMTEFEPAFWHFNGFKVPCGNRFISACWLLPMPHEQFMCVFFYHEDLRGDVEWVSASRCMMNAQIPRSLTSIIAMREFLKLRLAADEPVLLPRNERRLIAKQTKTEVPEIRLISLRLKESSGWHSLAARRYRHRWITSGHWRRLSEPLKKDSKRSGGKAGDEVVWVVPHEKGPIGTPLLAQRPTVYVAHR